MGNKHYFRLDDAYHNALECVLENETIDPFFDRIKYFVTFGNGENVSALDFIYFTANNLKLEGVVKTMQFDNPLLIKIQQEMEKIKQNPKKGDVEEQINVKRKVLLCFPNEFIGSDHLPIAAKFILTKICPKDDRAKHKIKQKKKKNQATNQWTFYNMNSF